ncbi:threonine/homoserine/homoserine lactone efflux protein [Paucibacter oligotrophus]|uniref:Threonine/homoserine/homoserine lactone efflux protein n=1 Tax=Roseateles oligotrophus TaxID=1769250 RepID=A0A840LEX6_9BURK|nr:LysE family transporter [Roseateles oligotrophus]MBB4843847.1 threonine/homoserine/homoserine lactone efflux protein [Roseateles oligotrophus]
MSEFAALIGIGAALCVGAASPGPSFVMVARTAASSGRSRGLSAALGMGLGALLFAAASLLGLNALFLAVPALYIVLKVAGGLYLAYLGLRIWRGAAHSLEASVAGPESAQPRKSYLLLGLATQVSNPKTAIVYASVFAAFLPATPSLQFNLLLVALVFFVEAGWYAVVATVLSSEAPRNAYLRFKKWIDRAAGGIMGALGLKLAASIGQQ